MGRVSRTVFVFVIVALAARILFAQREKPHPIHEQTLFSEDRPLQNPTPLPEDVLKLLLSTEEASHGLAFANESERKHPAKLFRVAEVHLSRPDQADLVVVGIAPMCGADQGWFWVVRSAYKNPKIVLFAGGYSVEVMNSRTNGYRNIRSRWSSASESRTSVYHLNGNKYKLWKETWVENRE